MARSISYPSHMRLDWVNAPFLMATHALGLWGLFHLIFHFSWATLVLAIAWYLMCGLSITGGYHRLFSHRAYTASPLLQIFYLCMGAASVQNSAIKWSNDHRVHHTKTDTADDPYSITRGFWWAHIVWVIFAARKAELSRVPDLKANRLVAFQHKYYIPLAALLAAALPAAIASLWGDALGGLLVAGFLRLTVQYHATFSINSIAHIVGKQPYSDKDSSRDSWVTALITCGEGYHNFHHSFPADYRNGVRAWQFDPTKWFVWAMSTVKLTSDLRRTSSEVISNGMQRMREQREQKCGEKTAA